MQAELHHLVSLVMNQPHRPWLHNGPYDSSFLRPISDFLVIFHLQELKFHKRVKSSIASVTIIKHNHIRCLSSLSIFYCESLSLASRLHKNLQSESWQIFSIGLSASSVKFCSSCHPGMCCPINVVLCLHHLQCSFSYNSALICFPFQSSFFFSFHSIRRGDPRQTKNPIPYRRIEKSHLRRTSSVHLMAKWSLTKITSPPVMWPITGIMWPKMQELLHVTWPYVKRCVAFPDFMSITSYRFNEIWTISCLVEFFSTKFYLHAALNVAHLSSFAPFPSLS